MSNQFATPGQTFSPWSSYDQGAAAWGLVDNIDLVLSSHLHLAESVQLPGLPGQLILGNAGTLLDPAIGYPLPTEPYTVGDGKTYPAPAWAWTNAQFGYALARPTSEAGSWSFAMKDQHGSQFASCGLVDRSLYCRND